MQELGNVRWILGISLVMFFLSVWLVPSLLSIPYYYYPPSTRTASDTFWYYVNRVDVLLFIATITTAALFTAGYGRNTLMHRLTISFFLVSMALLFLTFVKPLLTPP